MIREALRRDECFTTLERAAYMAGRQCAEMKLKYLRHGGRWACTFRDPCVWCAWVNQARLKDN